MSLFDVNETFLRQCFIGLDLPYGELSDQLNLDLAHMHLLSDCYKQWQSYDLPDQFWLYLLLLVDEVNRGSSCLDRSSKRCQDWQKQFNLPDWQTLRIPTEHLTITEQPVLVDEGPYLFFEKYYRAEQTLQQQIKVQRQDYQGQVYTPATVQDILGPVLNSLVYPLNREQIQAVITGLLQPFSLVSGGPGTGKTTMVVTLLRCLHALGVAVDDMALAAPTGRAAYRMSESVQFGLTQGVHSTAVECSAPLRSLEAQTMHRLIGKSHRFNQRNRYHDGHRLPYKVIVIDEVSMVDLQLMTELLAAVAQDCRVILVGDQFQLPSVESGAVLADLMPPQSHRLTLSESFASQLTTLMTPYVDTPIDFNTAENNQSGLLLDTCTVLRQSHRSTRAIQAVSEYVRLGDADGFFQHPNLSRLGPQNSADLSPDHGVFWLPAVPDSYAALAIFWHWFKHHIDLPSYHKNLQSCLYFKSADLSLYQSQLEALFALINQQQILTLINRGGTGQEVINQYICKQLKHHWQIPAGQRYFHGQVVMMRHNDYDRQLFNGDVGVILESDNGWQAVFPGQGSYRAFALPLLSELSTAFAITVHKSQGSEYRHVLITLPADKNNRLLSREIIYTGMTRAKSSVLLYGDQAVLTNAIKNHSERQSGLQFW